MRNLIHERIQRDTSENDIVLYIKGTAVFPQCGFSAAVVQIFSKLGIPFKDINIMEDAALHEGLKTYAKWPKTPQVYIKGQFAGGADILREMYATGELQTLLKSHNLTSPHMVA